MYVTCLNKEFSLPTVFVRSDSSENCKLPYAVYLHTCIEFKHFTIPF